MYTVSLPDKHGVPLLDLSNDQEAATTCNGLTATQLAIRRVITKVFHHYNIPLEINGQIYNTFKAKLWRMGRATAVASGGKRDKQIENWLTSTWEFTINGIESKRQLLSRKRKVEEQLKNEVSKREHLEAIVENLQKDVSTLQKVIGLSNHSRQRKRWS